MVSAVAQRQSHRYSSIPTKFCILTRCFHARGINTAALVCGICVSRN